MWEYRVQWKRTDEESWEILLFFQLGLGGLRIGGRTEKRHWLLGRFYWIEWDVNITFYRGYPFGEWFDWLVLRNQLTKVVKLFVCMQWGWCSNWPIWIKIKHDLTWFEWIKWGLNGKKLGSKIGEKGIEAQRLSLSLVRCFKMSSVIG